MSYLSDLSTSQKKAVLHPMTPLLVIAGAGSGKTRVLTRRIAHLIEGEGLKAGEILGVTFTRKAAMEMRGRLRELLGDRVDGLTIGTFHSVCARWLRSECETLDRKPNFIIYDAQDTEHLIASICKEMKLDKDLFKPKKIARIISKWKNRLVEPGKQETSMLLEGWTEDSVDDGFTAEVLNIYSRYTKRLIELNAFDFDDLICGMTRIFLNDDATLDRYRKRYKAFLIDEYQDTNHAQSRLMHLLATSSGNIFAVGDDDQSIYRFRGADVGNILRFTTDYKNASTIVLEENYRSTGMILKAALGMVEHNKSRHGKKLATPNPEGEKIEIVETVNERDEAVEIVKRIQNLVGKRGYSRNDIVVLFRTNVQTRPLEDAFARMALPYRVVGAVHFYERREIKDVLAYLRLVVNPEDMESFYRIINVPRRGIGVTTVEKVASYANRWGVTPFKSLERVDEMTDLSKNSRTKLAKFRSLILTLMESASRIDAYDMMKKLMELTGYKESLSGGESREQSEKRKENVESLINGAAEFVEMHTDDVSIERYLEEISLISDVDRFDPESGAVTLMTMHSVKGLEFPVVIIAGAEDGLIPHKISMNETDGLEDERRLLYVAMTRAREKLLITYATQRFRYEGRFGGKKSRFLDEIPKDYCIFSRSKKEVRKSLDTLITAESRKNSGESGMKRAVQFRRKKDVAAISVGDKVRHKQWGTGKVVKKDGLGQDAKLTILFEDDNLKKVMLRYASLEKI